MLFGFVAVFWGNEMVLVVGFLVGGGGGEGVRGLGLMGGLTGGLMGG